MAVSSPEVCSKCAVSWAGEVGSGCESDPYQFSNCLADPFRFLIEGLICVIVGIIAFFVMPPSITEPAVAFKRKDGTNKWWTEEEEKILVNRLLRDDPTKGDLNNRTAVTPKGIWNTLTDFDLWPIFIVSNTKRPCS